VHDTKEKANKKRLVIHLTMKQNNHCMFTGRPASIEAIRKGQIKFHAKRRAALGLPQITEKQRAIERRKNESRRRSRKRRLEAARAQKKGDAPQS